MLQPPQRMNASHAGVACVPAVTSHSSGNAYQSPRRRRTTRALTTSPGNAPFTCTGWRSNCATPKPSAPSVSISSSITRGPCRLLIGTNAHDGERHDALFLRSITMHCSFGTVGWRSGDRRDAAQARAA